MKSCGYPCVPSAIAVFIVALFVPLTVYAEIDILTNRYDPQRTGANLRETKLTTANVNVDRFGKLYSYPVDGAVYAQPLYVSGVTIKGVPRNVLYVATMNDMVYAFDADGASLSPLWTRNFTNPPSVTAVPITDIVGANLNIVGTVGIQSTPVIDRATGTLYLVARTKENGAYVQRLHALDIATGQNRTGSPVTIQGSAPGTALDASGGVIRFDPKMQNQRAGLALSNGVVLVAWASHEDAVPYHGWIMGFDATRLARVGVFLTTADAYHGGIWQGGRAPTIDASGHAYFATGNGAWDGVRNFGDSLLKFNVSRTGLALVDYFTPGNEAQLNIDDDDLSGSGFTLLPGTTLLIGGGKEGVLYVLDADPLGHKVANDTQIVQKFPTNGGHVMGGPVFWQSAAAGPLVYNWAEDDVLKAYRLKGGQLENPPHLQGQIVSPGHPGGSLIVSANQSTSGTGIVWASLGTYQDGIHGPVAGVLRAFDAESLRELWNSEQNAARDRVGTLMKFVPPVVANGKVYLPNQDGAVGVYGALPADFAVNVTPSGQVLAPGGTATFTVTVSAVNGFTGRVDLSASGQPSGSTVSFNPASIDTAGTSALTITVPANVTAGSFALTVTAACGTRVHTLTTPIQIDVPPITSGLGAIGVNFMGNHPTGLGAAETAGVVPQFNWNNASGATRSTPLALVDETGTPTGATITWASNNTWALPITDAAGDRRLMKGYLDTSPASITTVTVTGLPPRGYTVYVYADGDNASYTRSGAYTISGPGITTTRLTLTDTAHTNFSTAFTPGTNSAGNYLKFTISAGGFTLTATPADSLSRRAPVNAVQIVPEAAPLLPRAIGVNFVGSSTMQMGAAESAGVIAKSNWNNAVGATRTTLLDLVDETGVKSGATITWASNNTWSTPITDAAGNRRMMKGYLDTSSTSTTTVTVAGLVPYTYDVYVYVDGDNRIYDHSAAYTISGAGISTTTVALTDPANTDYSTTFTRANNCAGNYVKFTINAGGFTLTAKPTTSGNTSLRAPVNGIQIVPVTSVTAIPH